MAENESTATRQEGNAGFGEVPWGSLCFVHNFVHFLDFLPSAQTDLLIRTSCDSSLDVGRDVRGRKRLRLMAGVLSETREAPQRPAGPPWTPGAGGDPSRPRTFNRTPSCSTFESDRAQSWIIFPRGKKSLTTHRMTQIPRERKCLKCHLKSKNPPSPESQAVS